MESLAKPALEAVRSGKIQIVPEHFTKVYFNWLENIRLVHLPPIVVGAPHSSMVLPRL
jgi:hypothetical protein